MKRLYTTLSAMALTLSAITPMSAEAGAPKAVYHQARAAAPHKGWSPVEAAPVAAKPFGTRAKAMLAPEAADALPEINGNVLYPTTSPAYLTMATLPAMEGMSFKSLMRLPSSLRTSMFTTIVLSWLVIIPTGIPSVAAISALPMSLLPIPERSASCCKYFTTYDFEYGFQLFCTEYGSTYLHLLIMSSALLLNSFNTAGSGPANSTSTVCDVEMEKLYFLQRMYASGYFSLSIRLTSGICFTTVL